MTVLRKQGTVARDLAERRYRSGLRKLIPIAFHVPTVSCRGSKVSDCVPRETRNEVAQSTDS
jgi:hypothetical protein